MKNKYIKNSAITAVVYIGLLAILYIFFNTSIGTPEGDYLNQHTMFLDYLRQNFSATHDLFPQWLMNFGLGQSFVDLFYYGMYNPFLLPFYLFPQLNPVYVFEIVGLIIMVLNTLAMTKLLELNNVNDRVSSYVSILSSFSGVIVFELVTEPMFIYYIPLFVLSLIALHYLVEKRNKCAYAFLVAMIFFTNFTFAPVISILQFAYFVSIFIDKRKIDYQAVKDFFVAYITGVLAGMLILLPTAQFMLNAASRTQEKSFDIHLFNTFEMIVSSISLQDYSSGIFIVGIAALIGTMLFVKDRKSKFLAIVIIVMLIFQPINVALNLFEYVRTKVNIFFIPLLWLLFAQVISNVEKRKLIGVFIVSFIIFILGNGLLHDVPMILYYTMTLIIFTILCTYSKKQVQVVIGIILISLSFLTSVSYVSNSSLDRYTSARDNEEINLQPYRTTNKQLNGIGNLNDMVPLIYTSLENSHYIQTVEYEYETVSSSYERRAYNDTFRNIYMQNLYGMQNDDVTVNPIVYGVPKSNVYSIEEYNSLSKTDKLYAANQGAFIQSDDVSKNYQNQFDIKSIYTNNGSLTVDKDVEKTFEIPAQYQNGVLTISFTADLTQDMSQLQVIEINDQRNDAQYADRYGVINNNVITFILNTNDLDKLDVKFSDVNGNPITYSNLNISYQETTDFEVTKMKVTEPENFVADLNNSMDFDINMASDGILATTIPLDPGYEISVDGELVDTVPVNNMYIGANLSEGNHHINITYTIPGFKVGLALTSIGFIIMIFMGISEYRISKRAKQIK